jgi:ribosomal protein S14
MDPEAVFPLDIKTGKKSLMTEAVRHFDITEWADYVRNTDSDDRHNQMKAHLQAGCSRCGRVKGLLSKFAAICSREASYEIPRSAEQQVKAMIGLARAPRLSTLQRIWASLVYDSVNDPQPVGVRGSHQINRQVLFHAGDYSVDLRFEHEKGSASMVLVGQIANQKTPDELLANLPVILVAGSREVTRSISNTFGEFQLEYVPESDLRLLVPLESKGQELEVQLGKTPQL